MVFFRKQHLSTSRYHMQSRTQNWESIQKNSTRSRQLTINSLNNDLSNNTPNAVFRKEIVSKSTFRFTQAQWHPFEYRLVSSFDSILSNRCFRALVV
mmetsp:Transcript_23920/g.56520  ORF Transcript_23920/g.56520 Transcript_23920/m.56520 type:complete len:97 (-) Transcript_23920:3046-3336(-)